MTGFVKAREAILELPFLHRVLLAIASTASTPSSGASAPNQTARRAEPFPARELDGGIERTVECQDLAASSATERAGSLSDSR